jgi:hypothetical protein
MSFSLLDPDAPAVASAVFVPQLPDMAPSFAPHVLLHLRVGLLNVAYSSGTPQQHQLPSAPVHQPLALPLSLHLHPDLLTAEQRAIGSTGGVAVAEAADSLASFEPPSLVALQRAILPSILANLPDMIAQVKVKKMDTRRGNTVGLLRTKQLVFTFTFKETQPQYHMLTVSAKRVRMLDAEAKAADKARTQHGAAGYATAGLSSSAAAAPVPGASLSSSLSSFAIPSSPSAPVSLQPLSALRAPSGSSDEGFYSGGGFASFLVSKHALHVRMVPTRAARERLLAEREAEAKRRQAQQERETSFEREEARLQEEEEVASAAAAATGRAPRAGDKRKQSTSKAGRSASAAGSASSHNDSNNKRTRHPPQLNDALTTAAAAALPPALEEEDEDEYAAQQSPSALLDEVPDDWLQLDV